MNLNEYYYIPSIKINAKVADLVEEGYHIEIHGRTHQRLSRKPRGRSVKRRLLNLSKSERILIYS